MLNASNLPELSDPDEFFPLGPWEDTLADPPLPLGQALMAWLQVPWVQVLLCVVAALPLAWPHMPPLTDLGGHLGRFAVQVDGGKAASLRAWYSLDWSIIPNLGADLLMQVLAPQMGLEPALKAIVIGIVVVQTGGFLALARVVHGHVPPTAMLALPLVYGYPFEYGFINFTLCTGLGTWALALWIAMDRPELRLARWLAFVPISCGLWICHLEGWALFCLLAAGCEFASWREWGREQDPVEELPWSVVFLRSAVPLSCLAVACVMFAFVPHATNPGETLGWFDIPAKLGMVVMALRDRWGLWDVSSVLLLIGVIVWTFGGWPLRARTFSRHGGLALGAMLASIAFLLLPRHIGGTSFVDMRLVPMILAVALIAACPRQDCPRRIVEVLAVVAVVFTGARFAGNAVSLARYDKQFTVDLPVLNSVPRDALLVTLTLKPCLDYDPWLRERRTHLAGYALARRHDFANDQWAMVGGQMLRVHAPAVGPFTGDPSQSGSPEKCRGHPAAAAMVAAVPQAVQYLWIVENGVARSFAGWHPIRRSPGSVLYTRDQAPAPRHARTCRRSSRVMRTSARCGISRSI